MAWKKILFSGSAAELHSVTATNAITASSFFGDGSQLSNITVSQAATVASEFTGQTSVAVTHNFDSKNVTVTVYNDSDVLILPASVTLTNLNTATVTFDSSTSGHIVVAKGGHVVSGSVNASDITGLAAAVAAEIPDNTISASVLSSPSQGTARLTTNGVAADVDLGLQTGDSPTFTNLTLSGNLEVQGTTTTVDSTTVQFADNIIALNGTGAANGGIAVNDANGPASGSILWDGANNKWIAGAQGSEKTVALLDGQGLISSSVQVNADSITNFDTNVKSKLNADNVLSSSAQIASDISGSFGNASASFAADILTNASNIAGISTSFTLSADSGTNDSFASGETLTFAGGNGIATVVTNGNIAINGVDGLISSSAQVNANTITNFDANVKTKLDGDGVISGSSLSSAAQGTVTLTTNGVAANVDTGLQSGDTPTFAGLTIAGDLTVTGNTFEAQVTNLNVEDKFITVNSGSSSGESGLVFGGADPAGSGNANSGSAIFWDSTNVFGFAQDVAASATSATLTSKLGNIETHANANPSAAPTFQGKGTIYVNEDSQGIFIYS
jgi:hypothetical protein|tara:strand:- start:2145 stop:3824 length:1680 start_codon:yes stop_codon:yes gene_type:complete